MKRLFPIFTCLIILCGCDGYNRNFYKDPDVDLFIKQLKDGTFGRTFEYSNTELPDFERKHIPALLNYINDMTPVYNYPMARPSLSGSTRWIAEGVLWTIDGIRLGRKYPCNMGILARENNNLPTTEEDIKEVAALYIAWWDGELTPDDKIRNIFLDDPLKDTGYYWK